MIRRVLLMALLLMVSLVSVKAQSFEPVLVAMPEEGAIITYFNQSWQVVDKTVGHSFYRKLIKIESDGYILQDFFSINHAKQTDPFKIYGQSQLHSAEIALRDGVMILWNHNGQKLEQMTYKNGLLEGELRAWYRNGQLEKLGYYKEGKLDGLWIFWDRRGNKLLESQYMKGEKVAQWRF